MTTRRSFLGGASAAIIAGAAPRTAWAATGYDVAIIGAGLAGLSAAKLCEDAGLSVSVLESSYHIGGRLHTLRDVPGQPEAGGIQIGAGYKRLKAIAADLGVELSSDAGAGAGRRQSPGNLYWVNSERSVAKDWPKPHSNPIADRPPAAEPAALLRQYTSGLSRFDQPSDWLTHDLGTDVSVEMALRGAGATQEELRLIETNFNGNSLASMSQIHLARSFSIYRSQPGPISTIKAGAQRLPEAMAKAIKGDVRRNTPVRALVEEADGVTVVLDMGRGRSVRAKHVICTAPFSALRHMPIQADLSPQMARMIAGLPYTRASFAYLTASEPFWQDDPYPDTLWTDDPLLGRVFVLSDGSQGGPPMLKLWTTGAGADMLDRLSFDSARDQIIARIEAARPSSKGKLKLDTLFSWQRQAGARGIYHHIGTGMARDLASAALESRQRLHFAGEHLAVANSGMEGAIESGERAARRVIELSA